MRRTLRATLLLLIVGGMVGAGWAWRSSRQAEANGELTIYGNVDVRQVELAFNGAERIARVLVEEGDWIRPGQLLGKLETERFEYAVQRAAAQLETQRQVVARLEAGTRAEEIRRARASLEEAEAAARDAARTHKRILALLPAKAASQQEADDARGRYETAQARVKAVKALLDLAIAGPRKEDIAEAKAVLDRYEAELALAKQNLKDTSLIAPCDGIVQERLLEVGDMASPQKPVYTIALIDPVWIRAYVSEPDLGKIWEGIKARVTTDSFPDKQYDGWIGFISPVAEFTPKSVETTEVRTKLVYQVRVFVSNPNNQLRLGMPATVRVPLDQARPTGVQPAAPKTGPGARLAPGPNTVEKSNVSPGGAP